MKNYEKKISFRNDKVERVLLYHFKWWKLHSNCVSWEERTYSTTSAKTWMNGSSFCYIYICAYAKE